MAHFMTNRVHSWIGARNDRAAIGIPERTGLHWRTKPTQMTFRTLCFTVFLNIVAVTPGDL